MKIIMLSNFSTGKFYYSDGDTLKDAIMPWLKNEDVDISNTANILDVLSGSSFTKQSLEQLGFEDSSVLSFDIKSLFNKASASFEPLFLNKDWTMDYSNASEFKFCPFCYSFKSGSRRFYVLSTSSYGPIILCNYRGTWNTVPLKYPGDIIDKYIPITKPN